MNIFSGRQQQLLHVLRSGRRGMGPKHWAVLRGSTFLLAVFVMTACALVSEEAKASPPADRCSGDCNNGNVVLASGDFKQSNSEKSAAYSRHLYDIAASTSAERKLALVEP